MTDNPKPPRAPRTVEQATELLDRVARLDADAASINLHRDQALANTNAVADALLVPVIAERNAIAVVLETWWHKHGSALLKGRRKTVELGGCVIGTKAQRAALTFTADDWNAAVTALNAHRWSKQYVRVTYSVDKKLTEAALDDKHGEQLRALGFDKRGGPDVFVLAAVTQPGTIGAAG